MSGKVNQNNDQKLEYEQLRLLSAYLQEAREEERKNVAREIHDELGQALTTIKLELSLLNEEIVYDATAALQRVQKLKDKIDNTIQVVKKIITTLRPGLLDDLGLVAAIEWQAREFQNRTGIVCEVESKSDNIDVKPEIAIAIFRIFQESLTNVWQHSRATRVSTKLIDSDNFIELIVSDNGRGITKEQINNPRSFGIIGIRERAEYWNGTVEIEGIANSGTTIKVKIPR